MKLVKIISLNNPFIWYDLNDYYSVRNSEEEEYAKYYVVAEGANTGNRIRKDNCLEIIGFDSLINKILEKSAEK